MPLSVSYRPAHLRRVNELFSAASGTGSGRLAKEVERVVVAGNRADRLRGVDRRGRPLVPWKVRSGKYAGASGPTLAPFGDRSHSVRDFRAKTTRRRSGWEMTAGYVGDFARILGYHAAGKAGRGRGGGVTGIKRDVFGLSPATHQKVRRAFQDFAAGLFRRGTPGR